VTKNEKAEQQKIRVLGCLKFTVLDCSGMVNPPIKVIFYNKVRSTIRPRAGSNSSSDLACRTYGIEQDRVSDRQLGIG